MARLALMAVGAVAAYFTGGISYVGLGLMAGSLAGAAIEGTPRGGPRLSDLHVTTSTYGAPIPWGWGTARIAGNVIWSYPLTEHSHGSGGKGMGSSSTYTYSWTGAVGLCSTEYTGPISRILKIWADTKLVYDCTGQSGISKNIPGSGGGKGGSTSLPGSSVINGDVSAAFNKVGKFRVYTGTQTQLPDAALEALVGSANAQAHRGMAYIVFEDIDLTNYGNRVPNWTFEVAFTGSTFTKNAFKFDPDISILNPPSSNGTGALDSFRHRVYFFNNGNGGETTNGIHAFNLNDASEYMFSSYSRSFHGDASQAYTPLDGGAVVCDDGYLWLQSFSSGEWIKIDPDTLLEVGAIPYSGTESNYPIPMKMSGQNFLFTIDNGAGGSRSHLFNCDTLTEVSSGTVPGGLHLNIMVCGGNQVDDLSATAFGLHGSNIGSSSLDLYSFTLNPNNPVITANLIATITPGQIDSDWTNFDSFSRFVFDATDGNVMFFAQWNHAGSPGHHRQYLVKLNTQNGAIMWVSPYENTPDSTKTMPTNLGSSQTVITSGIYSVMEVTNNNMWTFSTQDGTSTKTLWPSNTQAATYQVWNDSLGALLTYGVFDSTGSGWASQHHMVLITGAAGSGVPVSVPVSNICAACNLAGGDIDVSTLTDNVEGYLLTSQMSGADGIKQLANAYLFDHNVSDNVLKFVKRGGSSVRTVPNTSLAIVDSKNGLFIQETRTQEVDLPYQVALNFLDPNHNYQQATQYARRIVNPYPTMYSKQTSTQSLSLVAQPEFMRQLAEKLLYTAWLNRTVYKTKMSWDNIDLDPTDVFTITNTDASTAIARIVEQSIGADLSVLMDSVAENTPTYTSAAVTDGGLGFSQQNLVPSVDTRLFLIDAPLLRDVDDTGQSYTILYDAASGYSSAGTWSGTNVWKGVDSTNFSNEGPVTTAQACSWGTAVNALGDTSTPFTMDNVNTLTLQMVVGGTNLASGTLLDVCNGANAGILLNSDGTVEIIQWLTRTLNGDGTYTLSQLLRGRRGTEVYTDRHAIGDIFILLTTSTVESIKMALADLNVDRYYKPVTAGTLFSSVSAKKFVSEGRALKPYAPVQVTATLAGSDIDLAWVRRTRVGGELMSYTGVVPLSEQYESYEVDVYNALGDTVLRTLRVDYGAGPTSSPGVTYLAADIATDFGSTPTSLNLAVYQISGTIGRGFGKLVNVVVM